MSAERSSTPKPAIVISGSLAFDHIMNFPGTFRDHILPDKVHVLSISFLFDSLRRQRGGVAGNIAYSLALLGEHPALIGAGGTDFAEYRDVLARLGVDTSLVLDVPDELTGSSFMITDMTGNQIAGFYPGASVVADSIRVSEIAETCAYGVVGPTTIEAMRRHAMEFAAAGCRLVYDPSQQVISVSGEDLAAGIDSAWAVIGSDYEFAVIERKTGLTIDDIAARVELLGVTYGENGSELRYNGETARIPIAVANPVVDPTGGGDAYRAGLLKGLLLGWDLATTGRVASLAATYAIEHYGPQEHAYTPVEFVRRFDQSYADFAGRITSQELERPAPRSRCKETNVSIEKRS
ncbi:MAG: carbohydrate kinase family protein [Chloroflexota bacterium]|nr:carbohydrate kinase family protein [Chloroflexota bacterium]